MRMKPVGRVRTHLEALAPGIKGHSLERSHETGLGRSARHQGQVLFYGPAIPAVLHLPASEALCGMQRVEEEGLAGQLAPLRARPGSFTTAHPLPPLIYWPPGSSCLARPRADDLFPRGLTFQASPPPPTPAGSSQPSPDSSSAPTESTAPARPSSFCLFHPLVSSPSIAHSLSPPLQSVPFSSPTLASPTQSPKSLPRPRPLTSCPGPAPNPSRPRLVSSSHAHSPPH